MADVDRLDIAAGIDTTGLDAGSRDILAKIDGIARAVNNIPPAQFHLDTTGLDADVAKAIAKVEVLAQAIKGADLGSFDKSGFLSGLADQLAIDAQAFKATSAEAKVLDQTIRNLMAESEALRSAGPILPPSAGGGGGPPNGPPPDQFSAFRREATAANAAVSELTATMALGNKGNLDYAVGLARAEAQLKTENAALAESAGRQRQYAEASRQASLTPFNRGLEEIRLTGAGARTELIAGAAAFETHAGSTKRATTAVAQLAATSIGAEGPVARLAESALLFSGGEVGVVAVAGAVLALAAAYNFLTTAQREADDKNQKLLAGLRSEVEQLSATERAVRGLIAAREEEAKARENPLAAPGRVAAVVARIATDPFSTGAQAVGEVRRQQEEKVTKSLEDQRQAQGDIARAEGATLTQSLQLHIATGAQRERAIELVKVLQSQEGALLGTDQQKLDNAKLLNALQEALADKQRQQIVLSIQQQAVTGRNAQQQQALAGEDAALQAHFNLQKTLTVQGTDEQLAALQVFYAARRERAVRAAQADQDAIRAKIANVQGQDKPTGQNADNESRQRAGIVLGLQQELQLRGGALAIQLRQLDASKDQATAEAEGTAALIRRMDAERIARAGGGNVLGGAPPGPNQFDQDPRGGIAGTGNTPATLLPLILQGTQASGIIKDVTAQLERERQAAERLNAAFHAAVSGIDGIVGAFAGLTTSNTLLDGTIERVSLLGETGAQVLGTIGGLVGSFGDLQKANADAAAAAAAHDPAAAATAGIEKFAAIAGIIGQGISLLGGILTHQSEAERERIAITEQNNQRLQELTAEIGKLQGAGGFAAERATLAQLTAQQSLIDEAQRGGVPVGSNVTGKGGASRGSQGLNEFLDAANINLKEFAQQLKDSTGIDILDKKGRVIADAFDRAAEAIDKMIKIALTPSLDPSAVRARLEAEDKLGISDRSKDPAVAAIQREREVQLQALNLSKADEDRIRAIDLSTAQGRAAFLKEEQDLAKRAETGGITADQLGVGKEGGFQSVDELIQSAGTSAEALNAFKDATENATKQLQGVPDFFKLGEAEFAARGIGPNDGSKLPDLPKLTPVEFTPKVPSTAGIPPEQLGTAKTADVLANRLGGGATLKDLADLLKPQAEKTKSATTVQLLGDVNLIFPTTPQNPAELIKAVQSGALRIALSTPGGDTDAVKLG